MHACRTRSTARSSSPSCRCPSGRPRPRRPGFDAVEFWWPFARPVPADAEVDRFVAAVQDAGVRLIGLNFAAGDMPGGDRGLVSWPGRAAGVPGQRRRARRPSAAGSARGRSTRCTATASTTPPGRSRTRWRSTTSRSPPRRPARIGAVVLVEPVSGAPALPAAHRGRRDRARPARRCRRRQLPAAGRPLPPRRQRRRPRRGLGPARRPDRPRADRGRPRPARARHRPVDLDRHLARWRAAGYAGWVGLEYVPRGPRRAASLQSRLSRA